MSLLRPALGALALALSLAACGGGSSSSPPPPPPPGPAPTGAVVSLSLATGATSLYLDRTLRVGAVATTDLGTLVDVTHLATFTSSAPSIIEVVGNELRPMGSNRDTASITATYGGRSATKTFTLLTIHRSIGPGYDPDPLVTAQWHLYNTGQTGYALRAGVADNDINALSAYLYGYDGSGVKVAVVDSGLEIGHEDLAANVVAGSWNFTTGTSDPTTTLRNDGDHGTEVAGLIAMVNDNGVGGIGVAPGAKLNGYNLLDQPANQTTDNFAASLGGGAGGAGPRSNDAWIFNQSFGQSNSVPVLPNAAREAIYMGGVTSLRGGLGAIFVKSSGNGFRSFGNAGCSANPGDVLCCAAQQTGTGVSCQNASMDPNNTFPANIVVGAVNASGVKSSYSTAGSAVWIASFGGEYGYNNSGVCSANPDYVCRPAMVTVDQSGCSAGVSYSGNTDSPFDGGAWPNASCNYTNSMNGTSSAAPVLSGVIALMLEANPGLSWRDVKHILASTAYKIDPNRAAVTRALGNGTYTSEPAWRTNAAGYDFHNWYGFGLVDADAAVTAALHYAPGQLGTYKTTGWLQGTIPGTTIPDNSITGVTGSITMPSTDALTIESIQLQISTSHTWPGDLGIELTHGSMGSVVLNGPNGFGPNSSGTIVIQLATNAFYGESTAGTWNLRVVDTYSGDTGVVSGWSIRFYGR